MSKFINTVVRAFKQFQGFFPSSLPTGYEAFEAWAKSIFETYRMPTQDFDSVKWVLSSQIIRFNETADRRSKYFFVRALRAAAAKQVAGAHFQDVKLRSDANRAAAAKAAAEAQSVATDGPKQ